MTDKYSLTFIEIDIPVCSLAYGVSPCTAEIGETGSRKCFNTLATCQDRANFTETTVTLRFAVGTDYLEESGIEAIPVIEKVDLSPAIVSLGEDLGQRASLSVKFNDTPWSDTGPGFDPYVSERPYDPFKQGSFWAKFRARQPYLRGRNLRWIVGLLGQSLEEMETRHFIVESTNGPDDTGEFEIIAKDILKLADGDRAQAPKVSKGYVSSGITNSATSLTLAPTGIGATYPASGLLALGNNEVVSFTRSGDTVTLTARGLNGTTAVAHPAQDEVQVVLQYTSQRPSTIIRDLLVNYADVPSSYIDLTAWETEAQAFNSRLYTAIIGVPTSVNKLISELIQQAGLVVWWDDVAQAVRFQVLRQIPTDAERFDDYNTLGKLQIEDQPNRRISEVWTHYSQINPLGGQDDPVNYRSKEVLIDLDAKSDYGSAAIKKIYSRWIPAGGRSAAARINTILLGRFRDPPRRFTFPVYKHGVETPTLGEGCVLEAFALQDETGALAETPLQIVRLGGDEAEYRVVADEMRYVASSEDPNIRDLIYDAPINGVNLRTSHDMQYVAPVGGETVNAFVEESSLIGATVYGLPAFNIGSWPSISLTQGARTSGSAVITGLASTSAMKVGQAITGNGVQSHTRILSIDSASQITLDKTANSTGNWTVGAPATLWTVIINLTVRGRLQGAGGNGGQGSYFLQGPNIRTTAYDGSNGSLALYTRYPINLILNQGLGRIWAGGGGGGGAGVLALSNHAGGSAGGGAGIPGGIGGPPTQSAVSPWTSWGGTGSTDSGGGGASSYASYAWYQGPFWTGVTGGSGGGPGAYGGSGGNHGGNGAEQQVGGGGAPGPAIDGVSYCKKTGTGSIAGFEIN